MKKTDDEMAEKELPDAPETEVDGTVEDGQGADEDGSPSTALSPI